MGSTEFQLLVRKIDICRFANAIFRYHVLQADFSIPIHFLKDRWQFALSVQPLLVSEWAQVLR
jgi:hypothetical protein